MNNRAIVAGERVVWIDTAKGLGMVLVLFGHSPLPAPIGKFIYAFHIPLFFFLSGYLFSPDKYSSFGSLCTRKLRSLFIPYCSFSLVNYLCWLCLRRFTSRPGRSIYKPFVGILFAVRGSVWSMCSGALWFVACLLCTEIIFYAILKWMKRDLRRVIPFLLFSSIVGYLYNRFIGIALPWSVDASFAAVVFYGCGHTAKRLLDLDICKLRLDWTMPLILVGCLCGALNARVDMSQNQYGNHFFYYVGAIAGIAACILVAQRMRRPGVFGFIGRNSMVFLGLHQFILFTGFDRLSKHLGITNSESFFVLIATSLVYVVAATVVLIPVTHYINHYLPFMVGKSRHA